jgi:FtsP/CotA-like multicopper oxidase with cupredoxin domain
MATGPGQGVVVRQHNNLPANHQGFGVPYTSVHNHGAHVESRSDGYPTLLFGPGESYDYGYPMQPPGFSTGTPSNDIPSTLWYHDHALDFTGANVYRGLVGFYLVFDDLDTGDETTGLRLPSGPFDVPLVLEDKVFAADGSLVFDVFDHNGFLGDKYLVNGAIQPFFHVQRRKYRFRFLDGSTARFYQIFLTKADGTTFTFDQIATEGGLLSSTIRNLESIRLAPALRVEIVVDFTRFNVGDEVYLENRLEQVDGRRPGDLLPRGPQLLKLIVGDTVPDPSHVPDTLRPITPAPPALIAAAKRRTFELNRQQGAWAINGLLAGDLDSPIAQVQLNTPEIWHLVNGGGGWAHPIHVHLDYMRVLTRNGQLPPIDERDGQARRDTVVLGPGDEVEVFLLFRDFKGSYVFHCHNLEHEDMAMMARFDTR